MYSYAVRHWAKPADPNIVNAAGLTPLTLASKLGRKEIFEEMLEIMKVVCKIAFAFANLHFFQPTNSFVLSFFGPSALFPNLISNSSGILAIQRYYVQCLSSDCIGHNPS